MATETDEFLAEVLPAQRAAEQAIHNGDVEPRLALWSQRDPVTLYGAKLSGSGWVDVEGMFREVASWFSDSQEFEFEVIAAGASGDLAYTVGYERNKVVAEGRPRVYTLRVTHVYRREDGRWRVVHRHADYPPDADREVAAR
jgi:ketosteroid isomerase-like protein